MNLILAVIVLAAVLMQGANAPAYMSKPATIGVVQPGSPAEKAGVRPGDVVTRLGSAETATWEQLEVAVAARPERELQMVVIRDGREQRLTIRPETTELRTRSDARFEIGTIGVLPDVNPHIRALLAGQPAEQAGLKAGDVILSIDGQRMVFASQVSEAISKHPDEPIQIAIQREGAEQTFTITPARQGEVGRIGVNLTDAVESFTPSPLQAVGMSVQRNVEMAGMIFRTLGDLFSGEASPRQLMGPVGIAQLSGESAQAGWIALFEPDGVAQPQPWTAEPAAHPGARRRPHLHHGHRDPGTPRLQPRRQGEDALRRVRRVDGADGDGDLQRPHPHRLDRKPDALEVKNVKAEGTRTEGKNRTLPCVLLLCAFCLVP